MSQGVMVFLLVVFLFPCYLMIGMCWFSHHLRIRDFCYEYIPNTRIRDIFLFGFLMLWPGILLCEIIEPFVKGIMDSFYQT